MPLWLREPRPGKTPYYELRGQYLGVTVERSTKTDRKDLAEKFKRKVERCIEDHGCYPEPKAKIDKDGKPFIKAANEYMKDKGKTRYVAPLIEHFGETALADIDQDAIDDAALALYPNVTPATRARQCYAVISAIMHHALGKKKCPVIHRPEGSKGREKTDWLKPEDAFAIIEAAEAFDPEFALYLRLLLFTGFRKSEGKNLLAEDVRPEEREAWLRTSKNGDPRMVRLKQVLIGPLFEHLNANKRDMLFRWSRGDGGGAFKHKLMRAKLAACGLPCPKSRPVGWKVPPHRLSFVGFHTFRHTFATWMRKYGGADLQGLQATGNWRDLSSVQRYTHAEPDAEWDRVESLPTTGETGKRRGKAA